MDSHKLISNQLITWILIWSRMCLWEVLMRWWLRSWGFTCAQALSHQVLDTKVGIHAHTQWADFHVFLMTSFVFWWLHMGGDLHDIWPHTKRWCRDGESFWHLQQGGLKVPKISSYRVDLADELQLTECQKGLFHPKTNRSDCDIVSYFLMFLWT